MSMYSRPDGRLYRITGTAPNGIVTAEYLRGETWREVINWHTRAVLTVRHTGTLPEGHPDSTTRAVALPKLREEAASLTAEVVPAALATLAKLTRDFPDDAAEFCDALKRERASE